MNQLEHDQRAAVEREAIGWLKTPYHPCARKLGVGVDCGMLLCEVYERAACLPHIEPGNYASDWHLHRSEEKYLEILLGYAVEIDLAQAKQGDALVYRYGRTWSHGALLMRDGEIVHAYKGLGVIKTRVYDYPVDNRTPRAFTLKIWSQTHGR